MAFFDNLGKKVTEAGQKTIQKTKELADISRLNAMISDQEKTVNNTYFQIGKLYVSIHQDNCEEDFQSMIHTIAEAEAKISDYKKQIQDIRGIQRCEKCGAEVPNGAAFCSSCGATMPKVEPAVSDDTVRCENCGATVKKGMRFCSVCGKPMEEIPVAEAAPAAEETVPDNAQKNLCPSCGARLTDDVAFCTECGTKL